MRIVLLASIFTAAALHAADPVVTEAVVNAPVDRVWRLFSTKEGIESWMVAKTEFELKIGATWRTSYSKDSNLEDDASIHHVILSFDPGRMLSFRTVKPPKGFPFPNAIAKTWNVVYIEPLGESRTKITARMLGYTDDEESRQMRGFFVQGNQQTMDALVKRLESGGN